VYAFVDESERPGRGRRRLGRGCRRRLASSGGRSNRAGGSHRPV